MHECQDSLIQGFQFPFLECTPLCYEQQKRFNIHRHSTLALTVIWYFPGLGDRVRLRLIMERDQELVPHVCSYHMIK